MNINRCSPNFGRSGTRPTKRSSSWSVSRRAVAEAAAEATAARLDDSGEASGKPLGSKNEPKSD
jgi:hypothetical protein